ncbi:protein-L-isoaspartate(D-aspartate) O-methyltransferase [Massilia scottii]|uniref:protein-L-isoaspartate(D-aspartate) O-methyltransferase n=1 Tax=Massilia scottii TaxID=3057166 RepID=UPI00279650AD|nr:protein-L-isoaspartate(D-aspartate) O-methyltransferase [Massilia sp. CCM 9029]MDQ1832522.1 protein-L-isoaspartate(D-aspartate) O-methyltransferase [Massilia sp. CCM 9029]
MSDKPDKRSTFPLPLSSVTGDARKGPAFAPARVATPRVANPQVATPGVATPRVATPQTATRNAARNGVQPNGPSPYVARVVASPSKSHSDALLRAQPLPVTPPRPDMGVSDAIRRAMVARVARQGVKDTVVLGALETVQRHRFIEPALSAQAYIDASLPIGHNQTISRPYIVARMLEVLRNGGALNRVLEIGTGCGYQAAVLSCIAKDVYSVERIRQLHELAKTNLRHLRIVNLRLHYGDGMLGLPQAAPFDGIILAAAGLEVPQALLDQLSVGGRLVAPVGAQVQHLQLITRTGKAEWMSETLEGCHFVPLRPGTV